MRELYQYKRIFMSNKRIFFTFFITLSIISAQPTFTEHVISTIALGANTVYAVDLDGDSDLDVLLSLIHI